MAPTPRLDQLVRGAAAGLAGSMVLQGMRTASAAFLPTTMPPIRQDPGEYMIQKAEAALPKGVTDAIPPLAEAAAAKAVAAGYGLTAGAIYALLRPASGDIVGDGVALGVGTWAAGYLGWLPALGLMPSVPEQEASELLGPLVRHAFFGIATVAVYRTLTD